VELIADFETNFDRAILNIGRNQQQQQQQQTGGQDTAAVPQPAVETTEPWDFSNTMKTAANIATNTATNTNGGNVVDEMLLQELSECRARLEKLESLNENLLHRSAKYEKEFTVVQKERDDSMQKVSNLELQLRMAKMEAEHAQRLYEEKRTSLEEMQMEIDLVTKASVNANKRAAQGEAVVRNVRCDKQHITELESQVKALQEWALASAEAKQLTVERVRDLEAQVRNYEMEHFKSIHDNNKSSSSTTCTGGVTKTERSLFTKASSIVIGAGDVGYHVAEVSEDYIHDNLQADERFLLKWKFDILGSDLSTNFRILKGKCETKSEQKKAASLFKERDVMNGAAGEIADSPFAIQNACTLLWSNHKSWIRPRTITYTIEVVAVKDY